MGNRPESGGSQWFEIAAGKGEFGGIERIVNDLYNNQDYDKAMPYINRLVEIGNNYGEYMMGQCYEEGHGVERDLKIAKEWYEKGWYKKYKPSMDAYRRLLQGE